VTTQQFPPPGWQPGPPPRPAKKPGVPGWLKWTGGGVAGVLVLGIIAGALADDPPVTTDAAVAPTTVTTTVRAEPPAMTTVTRTAEAPAPKTVTKTVEAPAPKPRDPEPEPAPDPEPAPAPGGSADVANAVEKAQSYLDFTSFSEKGLIEQLEFDGFSTADATTAVRSMDINWNEQAAKKAASYLEFTSFSRSGLVDQLVFDGFTAEQAQYGVDKAY